MAMWLLLPRLCLLLFSLTGAARSTSPVVLQRLNASAAANPQIPPGVGRALSAPIIGHGGRFVACSGKNLLAFHRNGSFAWIVPLGYNCRQDISLVTERDKIYLVAEDKVIKITPQNVHTSAPAGPGRELARAGSGRAWAKLGLEQASPSQLGSEDEPHGGARPELCLSSVQLGPARELDAVSHCQMGPWWSSGLTTGGSWCVLWSDSLSISWASTCCGATAVELNLSEEIMGLSTSSSYSSLFITIANRGLFSFSLRDGQLQWSAGPVIDRFGYRLGCKRNISGCYFSSDPVVDQCEGTLYITNTEGQLYSVYIHSHQYRWIQDLSSIDKVMTIAPGNNGRLYIVLPRKSVVMGIDVLTGNISWQQRVGPLSNEKILPAVDSNGWISIGSLDGIMYSVSPDGDIRKFLQRTGPNSVIHASPVLDCSGFSVYISQTIMEAKSSQTIGDYTYVSAMKPSSILFTLLAPATGTIYWTEKYPGQLSNLLSSRDLDYFTLDETILLTALSAARIGSTVQCYTRRQKIAWTCRKAKPKFVHGDPGEHNHVLLLFFFQLFVIVIQAVVVRFCCIFWRKKKLQNKGLQKFLEKRRSLHTRRRVLGKIISELEQKASQDASSNETLEHLGEMVKVKEGVERKLYTSYSLGRDVLGLKQGSSSLLPLYNGKHKSHSFHGAQRESITIFNTLSNSSASSEDRTSSSYSSGSGSCSGNSSGDMEFDTGSRSAGEAGPSNTADVVAEGAQDKLPADVESSYQLFMNPLYVQGESSGRSLSQREEFLMQRGSAPTKRMWLKRRRTLSSTN